MFLFSFFPHGGTALVDEGHLWTSDLSDTEISTWQHTTLKRDRQPRPRRDLNPQFQQASGCRPTA